MDKSELQDELELLKYVIINFVTILGFVVILLGIYFMNFSINQSSIFIFSLGITIFIFGVSMGYNAKSKNDQKQFKIDIIDYFTKIIDKLDKVVDNPQNTQTENESQEIKVKKEDDHSNANFEKRDEFIFKLISNRYKFEWDRTKILDSKSSNLLGFIGLIITLEITVIFYIFKEFQNLTILSESVRNIIFILILIGIICLIGSAFFALLSIYIRTWPIVPDTDHLIEKYTTDETNLRDVIGPVGNKISETINQCALQNDEKATLLKRAYILFFLGIAMTIIIIFILVIVIYPQKSLPINCLS